MFLVCFLLDFVVLLRVCVDSGSVLRRHLCCRLCFPPPRVVERPSSASKVRFPRRLAVELLNVWLVIYLPVYLMFLLNSVTDPMNLDENIVVPLGPS